MKRLLNCTASEIRAMTKDEKLTSIALSEGRTIVSEMTLINNPTILPCASLGELYATFGSDLILLNMFDVFNPKVHGIEVDDPKEVIHRLKALTGKMVGINLEPVDPNEIQVGEVTQVPEGRQATKETALAARDLGVDLILLTGNPGTGVSNNAIIASLKEMKRVVGNAIIFAAGKMHAAGSLSEAGENIVSKEIVASFIDAGAEIILLPAPGTVPGVGFEFVKTMITFAHSKNVLTMTAIGTSQEESTTGTIERIALMCKMVGTDIHHIGDAGYAANVVETIMTYSFVVRGKRHTYNRMATSPLR